LLLLLFGVALWDWSGRDGGGRRKGGLAQSISKARKELSNFLTHRWWRGHHNPSKTTIEIPKRANTHKKTPLPARMARAPCLSILINLLELFHFFFQPPLRHLLFALHLCVIFILHTFQLLFPFVSPSNLEITSTFAKTESNVHYKRNTSCLILLFIPLVSLCDIMQFLLSFFFSSFFLSWPSS